MCQLPASHQARHWYVKDRKKMKAVTIFIYQSVSRTVAKLSDFAFSSKLSFTPCLPKSVIFISSDMIPGGSLSPAVPFPAPKLVIQQVEDTIRSLGRSNDQSKRWHPSSHQLGKPLRKTWYACAIRLVLDAWEFSGAFNSTSELWVFWELRINRTGSSPIIVPGPLIKLRATDEGSKGYIFIQQALRLSEFDKVLYKWPTSEKLVGFKASGLFFNMNLIFLSLTSPQA